MPSQRRPAPPASGPDGSHDPVVAAKVEARRAVRAARRDALPGEDRSAVGARLAAAALAVAQRVVPPGGRVTAYQAMSTEPPTEPMIAALQAAGYDIIVPVTLTDRQLDWCHPDRPAERLGAAAVRQAALVLAPGLSVDETGTRLGQGGGYYDTALAGLGDDVPVLVVLNDRELVPGPLPREGHDRRVDGVLTPGGVRWLSSRPGPS